LKWERQEICAKINKQAYKRGHYAIAFLLAGMLELLFCIALRNEIITLGLSEKKIRLLMLISGGTLFAGIYNMLRYYALVCRVNHEKNKDV